MEASIYLCTLCVLGCVLCVFSVGCFLFCFVLFAFVSIYGCVVVGPSMYVRGRAK